MVVIKISKINYNLNFDLDKKNDKSIVNYVRKYSDEYYIKQSAVIKMILKIAILDMNILNFTPNNSLSSTPNKNNNSLSLDSVATSLKEETIIVPSSIESNDNLYKLINNSINSLI